MREKKYQIFVSSTYEDLKDERQAAVEAILSAEHIPAGMELFSAGDKSQWEVIKRWIDDSDIYMLILGGRYGSIEPISGKSYTHLEYDYAVKQQKPLFAVVVSQQGLDNKTKILGTKAIEELNGNKLQEFKKEVQSKMVKFFDDTKDIKLAVYDSIASLEHDYTITGWVKGNNQITAQVTEELARLTKENNELKNLTEEPKFNSLKFSELKELLIEKNKDSINYIKKYGHAFAKGLRITYNNSDEFNLYSKSLFELNIIKKLGDRYFFTEDGHKFYIKLLNEDIQTI